jgi:acyl transferase domain-containing protein
MGKDLFLGLPGVCAALANEMPESATAMIAAFDGADDRHRLPSFQLAGSSYLCQLHARITRDLLGLLPTAAMGLSSGETNAMFAFDVWHDMDSLVRDINATELYRSALAEDFTAVRSAWELDEKETVDWENYRVLAPVEQVRQAVQDEDYVYLTIIQTDRDSVIGGKRSACESVLARLGNPETIPLGHDLAVHCAAVAPFESSWREIHTRKTRTVKDVRFYSNYLDGVYSISKESVADALTGQALQTIDFPRIVNAAWNDGVRVFIEHGPRNSLSCAIDEILGDKPHLAVALDHSAVPSMTQLYRAVAELWCAGVDIDLSSINLHQQAAEESVEPMIRFRLRLPAIKAQAAMLQTQAQSAKTAAISGLYYPPNTTAGPSEGRLIPPAPALAYTINVPNIGVECHPATAPVSPLVEQPSVEAKTPRAAIAPVSVARIPSVATSPNVPADALATGEHQLLLDSHRRMLQAHQAFLAAQLEGQRAYEETMTRMQTVLLGGAPAVAPSIASQPSAGTPTLTAISQSAVASGALAEIPKEAANIPEQASPGEQSIERPGPSFSREQVEILAGGQISSVFGPLFEQQDHYAVQVRMPEPPLLLCDRVMGIEGEAGSMGTGTVWTETDVHHDSWYLHRGRMPPGIFIESGQADLLLISWLGIDFHNKGERAYRLLGCAVIPWNTKSRLMATPNKAMCVCSFFTTTVTSMVSCEFPCVTARQDFLPLKNWPSQPVCFGRLSLPTLHRVSWCLHRSPCVTRHLLAGLKFQLISKAICRPVSATSSRWHTPIPVRPAHRRGRVIFWER